MEKNHLGKIGERDKHKLFIWQHHTLTEFLVAEYLLQQENLLDEFQKLAVLEQEGITAFKPSWSGVLRFLIESSKGNYIIKWLIEFLEEQQYWWTWKPHYFDYRRRYYNYPYGFAELVVLGMWNKYKEEGKAFIPKFKTFLASGGSKSPKELAEQTGIDLTSIKFWENGMKEVSTLFEKLKKLYD